MIANPCNGQHPGREAKVGNYDFSQCLLCWQSLNNWPPHLPISQALAHLPAAQAQPATTPAPQPIPARSACKHLGRRVRLDDGSVKQRPG